MNLKSLLQNGVHVKLQNGYAGVVVRNGENFRLVCTEDDRHFIVHDYFTDDLRYDPNQSYNIVVIAISSYLQPYDVVVWTRNSGLISLESAEQYIEDVKNSLLDMKASL